MPVFRCRDELHYFAHVPKCAGQSVEAYLETRFGALALKNNLHYRQRPELRWSRTSPQHIAVRDLQDLLPESWIASAFAVVRHPYTRLVSAYNYASQHLDHVALNQGIADWLAAHDPRREDAAFAFDNHLRPQSDLVPAQAAVFRLEDGLDQVVAHLDTLAGDTSGPREIGHLNDANAITSPLPMTQQKAPEAFFSLAAEIYAADFARFGYDPDARPELVTHVPRATLKRRLSALNRKRRGSRRIQRAATPGARA